MPRPEKPPKFEDEIEEGEEEEEEEVVTAFFLRRENFVSQEEPEPEPEPEEEFDEEGNPIKVRGFFESSHFCAFQGSKFIVSFAETACDS